MNRLPRRTLPSRLALALCASSFVLLSGCEEKLNDANFNAINTGMTLSEVEKILGGKGEKQEITGVSISAAGVGGSARGSGDQYTYVWKDNNKEISVTTQGGKVISKGKAGF
jgi:hypothetical protein